MFKKNINYFFLKFFFDNKEFQKKKKNFLKKNGNILLNYNLIKKGVKNQKQKYFYNLNCIKFATFKKKKFFFLRV